MVEPRWWTLGIAIMEQARVEWIGESWDMVHASDEEEITYVDKEKCGFAWGGNSILWL